jgi:cytochrome b6-f complex iron-sulfur subunit
MKKYSRRMFLQTSASAIGLFFVLLWEKISIRHWKHLHASPTVLPFSKNRLVTFFKDFLIINRNNKTTVLSSHCTHLGCSINKVEDGKLVCPCHGSAFDLDGNPVKGPAYKTLKKYPATVNSQQTQIKINTENKGEA